MKSELQRKRWLVATALMMVTGIAQAHPGHGGMFSGLAHPWGGLDHLAAMAAVGVWAATLQGAARLALPGAFVTAMLVGVMLPAGDGLLALAEQGIVLSLLVLGAGLLAAVRLSLLPLVVLMALAGLSHGYAHGAEIPAGDSVTAFIAGMTLSTVVLHAVGAGVGVLSIAYRGSLARIWGAPVLLLGVAGMMS